MLRFVVVEENALIWTCIRRFRGRLKTMRGADTRTNRCVRATGHRNTKIAPRCGPTAADSEELSLDAATVERCDCPKRSLCVPGNEYEVFLLNFYAKLRARECVPFLNMRPHVFFDLQLAIERPFVRVVLQEEQGPGRSRALVPYRSCRQCGPCWFAVPRSSEPERSARS